MLYKMKSDYIEAFEVSVENMEALEKWSRGSIKGTKLPPEQRAIYVQPQSGEEIAAVGDLLVDIGGEFHAMKPEQFHKIFEEVSS